MRRALAALALWLLPAAAGAAPAREAAVEEALRGIAAHAETVLLTPEGKVRAEYDPATGAWSDYEPAWHTGQMIWGLVEAAHALSDPAMLALARRSGDWWLAQEFQPPHPFAGLINAWHGDKLGRLLNWTTISDGTPGLFALSHATGDARYAEAASRSGAWLWANTRVPTDIPGGEGLFYNIFDAERGRVLTDWNPHTQGPVYDPAVAARLGPPPITELARPNIEGFLFADICRFRREPLWCARFLEQARFALARQSPDGLWMAFEPNDAATGRVHPRFNIWNAEALLEAHALSGDRAFLEAAARTARFYQRLAAPDGAIAYTLYRDGRTEPEEGLAGSAVAFHGLLMLRLQDYGYAEFAPAIARAAAWLLANRYPENHPDPNLRGGVPDTRVRKGKAPVQRDLGASFALRFLALYLRDLRGEDVNTGRTP